jgi:hypothetical protein
MTGSSMEALQQRIEVILSTLGAVYQFSFFRIKLDKVILDVVSIELGLTHSSTTGKRSLSTRQHPSDFQNRPCQVFLIKSSHNLREIRANMMATHVSHLPASLGSGDGQGLRDTRGALSTFSHALRSIPLAIDAALESCATIAVPVAFLAARTTKDTRCRG